MNKNSKKIIIMVVAILLTVISVGAAKLNITWDWEASVPGITAFRYQLDSDAPETWNVVSSEVTTFTAENLESTVDHYFYLQQSFDGIAWSDSAIDIVTAIEDDEILSEAKVIDREIVKDIEEGNTTISKETTTTKTTTTTTSDLTTGETTVVSETATDVVKADDSEVASEENKENNETVVSETTVTTTTTKEVNEVKRAYNQYYTQVSLFGGSGLASWANPELTKVFGDKNNYGFDTTDKYVPFQGLEISFNNVARWGRFSGLGFKLGADYQLQLKGEDSWKTQTQAHKAKFWEYDAYHVLDTYFAMAYNLKLNKGIGMNFFVGGFGNFSWDKRSALTFNGNAPSVGFGWLAGIDFNIFAGDLVTLSATPVYRYEWGNAHQVLMQASLGFRF